jgi:hypothetical protein
MLARLHAAARLLLVSRSLGLSRGLNSPMLRAIIALGEWHLVG